MKKEKNYDFKVQLKDTVLAKSYGLPKIHKRKIPLEIVH